MTRLERRVHIHLGSVFSLRRYLTLFYGFTLGLGLLLAYFAIALRMGADPKTPTTTQVATVSTTAPTGEYTQVPESSTPTSLPAVPATPNEKTPSSLGVTSAELRGLTVSFWHPWSGTEGATLQGLVDEFNRTNRWGITVQASAYDGFGALEESVANTLTTGALPDVLVDYGYQARYLDNNGAVVDLTPYIHDPLWGMTSDEQADFFQGFWGEDVASQIGSTETHRLAVPYFRSAYVLFYNEGWAREMGFASAPKTQDEFRMQACTAAVMTAEKAHQSIPEKGGLLVTTQPGAMLGWIDAFGGDIAASQVEDYSFNTPEANQALTYLKELQEGGCAWMEPEADAQAVFASRGALFVVASLLDIPAQQAAFTQAGGEDDWTVIAFPSRGKAAVDTYGPSLLVTRSTPSKQLAAWLVIEWLVYPPNQAQWATALEVYPTRTSSLNYLGEARSKSPQLAQALTLMQYAHSEPTFVSWGAIRWALQDATNTLFDPKFTRDQIPALLVNMDNLAAEVVEQGR